MEASLKSMLDQLGIPAEVQSRLEGHRIIDYQSLKSKRAELEGRALSNIDGAWQKVVVVALVYLQSLVGYSGDPLSQFNIVEFADFTIMHGNRNPNKLNTAELVSEDSMEIDDEADDDDDDELGRLPVSQRTLKVDKKVDTNAAKEDPLQKLDEDDDLGKFELMDQAFKASDDVLPALDDLDPEAPKKVQATSLPFVDFEGRRFNRKQCYYAKSKTGKDVVVGIRSFKSETEANCVRVLHFSDTFLGKGEYSEDFADALEKHCSCFHVQCSKDFADALEKHCSCFHVQCSKHEVHLLSELGQASSNPQPAYLPKVIYEPRTKTNSQSFSYKFDQDRSNRVQVRRKEMRVLEGFAGAGGMHLGFKEEGFTTAMAVEWDAAAVKTFRGNNKDVLVHHDDVNNVTREMETDPAFREKVGKVDVIHVSSPCQGFSKANRNEVPSEADIAKNKLSYTFVDWLRVADPLIGTFENVEGMWSKKGMPYLRKLLVGTFELGYQFRVMKLRAKDYGDPQDRPRIIIFASKPFVRLPDRPPRTHGPGTDEPYVTTKEVLEHLRTPLANKKYPNMKDTKTTSKKVGEKDFLQLDPDGLAPTVLCSSSVAHYADKGRDGNFRPINVRETAALQSFPYDYIFEGTIKEMYQQAGNAVPVRFAAAIARSCRASLRLVHSEELDTNQGDTTALSSETESGTINCIESSTTSSSNEHMADATQTDMHQMTLAELEKDDGPPSDSDSDKFGENHFPI